jgi:hypothetical protein
MRLIVGMGKIADMIWIWEVFNFVINGGGLRVAQSPPVDGCYRAFHKIIWSQKKETFRSVRGIPKAIFNSGG